MNSSDVTPRPRELIIAATLVLAVAMGIGRFAYTPLLPEMQAELGWSLTEAGDIASANYVGYLAGALLCALLARTGRDRLWLGLGFAGSAGTTLAGMSVEGFAAWWLIRFGSGVASAFCLIFGTGLLMHALALAGRLHFASRQFAGVGLGILLSVALLYWVPAEGVGARWGVLGVASAVLLLLAWRAFSRVPPAPPEAGAGLRLRGPSPELGRLIVAYGLFGIGYVITATFIVAMARQREMGAGLESAVWLTVGLFVVPSVLIWQRVADRVGLKRALMLAYGVEAAGVLCSVAGTGAPYLLLAGALLGGTFAGITALGLNAARALAVARQNESIAWMTVAFGVGQLIGPAAAGRLAELSGSFVWPTVLAAALLVLGMWLIAGMNDSEHLTARRPPDFR